MQAPFRSLQLRLYLVVFPITLKTFIKYKCTIQLFNHIIYWQTKHRKTATYNEVLFQRAGGLQGEKFSHILFRSQNVTCLSSLLNKISFHIKIFKSIAYLCQNNIFARAKITVVLPCFHKIYPLSLSI